MAAIRFENVSKRFGNTVVIPGLDLEVKDQEFLVLLGPSGCGKTTTMRMIAGLESVSGGDVYIGDTRMNDVLPKYRDVAMVFQSYALYPHMTIYQNIEYPLKIRKLPLETRKQRVLEAARKVELEALLDRTPRQLSGGQRQRVALARAIIRRPTAFLMDEPLSNLDAKLRIQMRAELKHLQHELAVTTVYVTHDQIEAMTLADRVAVMHEGAIQQLDTPRRIYNEPANLFVAGFIGSPGMNFITGEINNGKFEGSGVAVPGVGKGTRKFVVLGVRPEDMSIVDSADAANIVTPIYSVELTGESTLVSVRVADQLVSIRAGKDFAGAINEEVCVRIDTSRTFLFDAESKQRIAA